LAAEGQWAHAARLLFAGQVDPRLHMDDLLDSFGVREVTHLAGRLDDAGFDEAVAASDVGLNLRWPTAREVSGPWLRMLSAGLPTVIVDAVHHLDIVTLDPRTWRGHTPTPGLEPTPQTRTVAVAVRLFELSVIESIYTPGGVTVGVSVLLPPEMLPLPEVVQEYVTVGPPVEPFAFRFRLCTAQVRVPGCAMTGTGTSALTVTLTRSVDVQPLALFVTKRVYVPALFTVGVSVF